MPIMAGMKWASIIRDLVEKGGLTQAQIAQKVGLSQPTISEILNSKKDRRISYEAGLRLVSLHTEHCKQEA